MKNIFSTLLLGLVASVCFAQSADEKPVFQEETFKGLKFRNIGPALMSGRIADIAIHPENKNIWYVAVGSGGVWKTINSATTWEPVFDDQPVYSIGCVAIDPINPNTVWVGTGENVGGRHVGFGDGVYKSTDGGKTWNNMGLKTSEHISEIIIHPENSDVIWVASQGPLWSKGGERGVFKSIDGGETWNQVLAVNEWTGATDLAITPENPDVLYAATWQRHRNVAAFMGGGPGSGIYRSDDGGDSWKKLVKGLPDSNMGKIGIALEPQNTDVIYAAIELDRRQGAVYRSVDRGESWTKQSETVSGGTGPHYYQELYASPHKEGLIYLADVRMQVSEDAGKTFQRMKEKNKHSDNHALVFRDDDPNYLLVGTDGGLYESFDNAEHWKFVDNLPVTQFYKVALDDAKPFYNVYGGTQDNNTQGGPSRTDNYHGVRNADWFITLFGDGHQPATEPGNPDIVYSEWQEGNLVRVDRTTGEIVYIKPQPAEGENYERYNWDAPILVSPHDPKRLYFASYRVWRSDDRGDSWKTISGDLTKNQDRMELPIMGSTQSWDSPWDVYAMSEYNTITSLSESPLKEGLIYAGTDDGSIHVTEDGGSTWNKIGIDNLPNVPSTAFVNDIKADLHDENTVYVALDNHKFGDFSPYLFKSNDNGKSWKSLTNSLPEKTMVWRIVQDHVNPNLLFCATEFGIYFSIDKGTRWTKLKGGIPTISFRDLAIQKRENDLVGASFGRGFYVFDDYSVLREITPQTLEQEADLFSVRDAWWYIQRPVLSFQESPGSQGSGYYVAPNPPFGATFTYFLKEGLETKEEIRKEQEKKKMEQEQSVAFPGWDAVESELREPEPAILLVVKDLQGNVVRRVPGSVEEGFHRVTWDLRYPALSAVDSEEKLPEEPPKGFMAAPGKYQVELIKKVNGKTTSLSGPETFAVKPLHKGALEGNSPQETVAFWKEINEFRARHSAFTISLKDQMQKMKAMKYALENSSVAPGRADSLIFDAQQELFDLEESLEGPKSKNQIGVKHPPTVGDRLSVATTGVGYSTYGPTPMHRQSLKLADKQLRDLEEALDEFSKTTFRALERLLNNQGAPLVK